MKLMIIQPTYYQHASARSLYKTRRRWLVGLTLPYLAALTPPDWEVELIDEQVEEIDFAAPVDLVAITTWTINSFRAYEISRQFRQRGIPVIMGGPHTFFHAEEALDHCDAGASAFRSTSSLASMENNRTSSRRLWPSWNGIRSR